MNPSPASPQRVAFGSFVVDLTSGQILKNGRKIRLQPQPFRLLELMLMRPGEVVTRQEVCRALWDSDTFVDFDHGLGTAINKIRETLGDSAESPRFVETLPRRGYRFIGEIKPEVTPEPRAAVEVQARATAPSRPRWPGLAAAAILGLIIASLAVVTYRRSHRGRPQPSTPPTVVQFTALPGDETSPAFSPDGSRIAFAWNGDRASSAAGYDLYVKAIGSEALLRLTNRPSEWLSPVWSPDGTQIAFHRMAGPDTGVYLVSALGGPERKLHATHVPYSVSAPISWSPDGKWIAFGDTSPADALDRMFLLSVTTLETVPLPHNPNCLHEALATFSPSGDRLAYVCVHSLRDFDLYTTAFPPNGPPQHIVDFHYPSPGLAWSADDNKLILSVWTDAGPELEEILVADGSLRRFDFSPNAAWPAVSPKGDQLAYSSYSIRTGIWRRDLLHLETPPVELISSTREQDNAQYSPDGKHIAFWSTRSGNREIWISDPDGTNLVQLSKSIGSAFSPPYWSPDGKKIVFGSHRSGHFEIYVADISENLPRKLETNVQDISTPSWSRDGKWIYFRSYAAEGHKIYRCPATGGDAVALRAGHDGTSPQESPDGNDLYFAARNVNAGLIRLSLKEGFTESPVEGLPPIRDEYQWTVIPGGVYFVPMQAPKSLYFFDFATKQTRQVFEIQKPFGYGLSLSPDGRWLLYTQIEEQNTDIMLADHFQ
jgi:Tol biopolymer transport system component/DNA-binding winged helix-turn-helix (wHTH) protein